MIRRFVFNHSIAIVLTYSWLVIGAATVYSGCANNAPPSLSPAGVKVWQANEAAVAIGTLQHTAIELNKVQVCEPAPCHPLLSDKNTGVVVDAVTVGLKTIEAVPTGWKPAANTALDQIAQKLDPTGTGKLSAYVAAARAVVAAIPEGSR